MSKVKKWHPDFQKYAEFILNHPNYKNLPETKNNNSKIKWVSTKKGDNGSRYEWWINKKKALLKNNAKILTRSTDEILLSDIAYHIHPTKIKVCSECGNSVKLGYCYPNKRLIKKLNSIFNYKIFELNYKLDILEIVKDIFENNRKQVSRLKEIFNKIISFNNLSEINRIIINEYINKFDGSYLTPGAMSNCPDRLDGYHTYAVCCRSKADKGRSKENLNTYSEDRRLYEFWSDGDWKAAQFVMGQFKNNGFSADHIGPISLGFTHRPKFQPMTKSQNSSKGNRMRLEDINILIEDEKNGESIISWHSKPMWDLVKKTIKNNEDAKFASKILKINMEMILSLFYEFKIYQLEKLLISFLSPEYAFYQHKLIKFNTKTGATEIKKIPTNKEQNKTNAKRYLIKSLESLDSINDKINRRNKKIIKNIDLKKTSMIVKDVFDEKGEKEAKKICLNEINEHSINIFKKYY